jgi:hypothetical protein
MSLLIKVKHYRADPVRLRLVVIQSNQLASTNATAILELAVVALLLSSPVHLPCHSHPYLVADLAYSSITDPSRVLRLGVVRSVATGNIGLAPEQRNDPRYDDPLRQASYDEDDQASHHRCDH